MEKTATLSPETLISEKLDIIIKAVNTLQQELVDIRVEMEALKPDVDDGSDPAKLFEEAWKAYKAGAPTYPVEELWDRVDERL